MYQYEVITFKSKSELRKGLNDYAKSGYRAISIQRYEPHDMKLSFYWDVVFEKEVSKLNMFDKSEYILAAALKRHVPKDVNLPNDLPNVEIGIRHFDIRDRFPGEVSMKMNDQGFLTSKGRFVSRKEAEVIARNCGQLTCDLIGGILTSEDLW